MVKVTTQNNQTQIPLVSIIAICYNHERYLEETLNSIFNQTYERIELIIIDSNSSDSSVNIITDWIEKNQFDGTFIRQKQQRSICQNLNEALAHVNGKYFIGVSCDDVFTPYKTARQVESFESLNSDYALLYSDAELIDENGKLIGESFLDKLGVDRKNLNSLNYYNELLKKNFIPAMSGLIRTETVKSIGGYDENLMVEDHDMWLRLSSLYKFYFLDIKGAKYRIHSNNLHKKLRSIFHERRYSIYIKHYHHPLAKTKVLKSMDYLIKNQSGQHSLVNDFLNRGYLNPLMTWIYRNKNLYLLYRKSRHLTKRIIK